VLATPATVYRLPRLDRRSRDVWSYRIRLSQYGSRRFEILHDEVTAPTITTTKTSPPQQPSYLYFAFTHSLCVHVLVLFAYGLTKRLPNIVIFIFQLLISLVFMYIRKFIVQNNKYIIVTVLKSVINFLLLL